MSEKLPRLHAHLEQYSVDYTLITFNWFLVVFVDSVVSDILFKIWDSFLYEGPKVGVPAECCGQRQWWPGGRLTRDWNSPAHCAPVGALGPQDTPSCARSPKTLSRSPGPGTGL